MIKTLMTFDEMMEELKKDTKCRETIEKGEMDMIRNFEKLLTDHPDMCCEVEPKDYPPYLDYPKERKPMTNYDRLISKTPEELVEWIESIEPAACPWRDDHGDNCRFTHCRDCWLSWLKSPMNLEAGK